MPSPRQQGRRFDHQGKIVDDVGMSLGFERGRQQGWHEAERTICKAFPKAAAAIRARFLIDKRGTIKL